MFVDFFIRRPVFATVCSIIIVLVGAVCIPLLPVDYYPQVAPAAVTVTAVYPGANAETVETAVTNVLEQEINGVEGLRYISSVSSSNGTSQITVTFNPGRDLDSAAIDVQNRVSQVQGQLPEEVNQNGITVQKSGNSAFIQVVSLRSQAGEYDELFVSNYAELYVRDALRRIRGVSDVLIFGDRKYAMRIWLDPFRLASYGLTAQDVVNAVRQQNIQVPAGQIGSQPSAPDQQFQINVQAVGRLAEPEEFAQIILRANPDGSLVRIADVGRVELGAQSYDTFFRIGGQEAVGIAITKQADANALEVAQRVKETLDGLAQSFPPGLIYEIPFDATLFINESVQEVIRTLLQAIGLVVLVLFVFLQDWRITLIPTITIPVALIGTFIFVRLFGFSIIQGPPGVSLNYTDEVIQQATAIMQGIPEIRDTAIVGGFSFTGPSASNGLIFASLKPWEERRRPDQSAQAIVGQLFGPFLGGISKSLVIPMLPPAIPDLGVSGGFSFQLQDRGVNDFNLLEQTAGTLFFVGNSPPQPGQPPLGLQINPPTFSANAPQLQVRVDRNMAQVLGIPIADVFGTLQTLLGGTYVNNFDLFNRNYRVYVQADQLFRANPDSINQFYVRGGEGQLLPLSSLVQVQETTGPDIINHFNLFRSTEIQGNPLPGFSSGQAIRSMEALAAQLLPQGFGFEWSGISLEEIESGGQAPIIFALGLVFVFLVLAAQFESYVDPFIILLAVPLAILGALSAQLLRGLENDIFCQVGLVMLIGLASKNSILIVEFANQLVEQGIPIFEAAIQAAETRFRAILMTALSTILGIFPLAVATGAGAGSRQSLGTAVIGGMFISTILSLFVVPVLYILIKGIQARIMGSPMDLDHLPPPEEAKGLLPE